MAKVVFVLPCLYATWFSGGILTVCNYANGLAERGHQTSIVTLLPSENPQWITPQFKLITPPKREFSKKSLLRSALRADRQALKKQIEDWAYIRFNDYLRRRAADIVGISTLFPEADITVATGYETALPAWRYGSGRKYYFGQHFEPLFASERSDPAFAEVDAKVSYQLPGLNLIANSTWLARQLAAITNQQAPVCLNAIDHAQFSPPVRPSPRGKRPFTVISYGGRSAEWKGIREAAEAIRELRTKVPDARWLVFGSSLLPEKNPIAEYEPLGFLTGHALRDAYQSSDVLLAPSWYESFPLFPLEAMSAGVAVVTTPLGVEDYAVHEQNCLIASARDSKSMADALIRLALDDDLRMKLAAQAPADARELTWEKSVARMAQILEI